MVRSKDKMSEEFRVTTVYEVFCTLCNEYVQVPENRLLEHLTSQKDIKDYIKTSFQQKGWVGTKGGVLCPNCYKMACGS